MRLSYIFFFILCIIFLLIGCVPHKQIQLTLDQDVDLTWEIDKFNELYDEKAKLIRVDENIQALKFPKSLGTAVEWEYKEFFETIRDFNNKDFPIGITLKITDDQAVIDALNLEESEYHYTLDTEKGDYNIWERRFGDFEIIRICTYDVPLSNSIPNLQYGLEIKHDISDSVSDSEQIERINSLLLELPPGVASFDVIFNGFGEPFPNMDIEFLNDNFISFIFNETREVYDPYDLFSQSVTEEEFNACRNHVDETQNKEFLCLIFFPKLSTYLAEVEYIE